MTHVQIGSTLIASVLIRFDLCFFRNPAQSSVPEEYICTKCTRKKTKSTKQSVKVKAKREKDKPILTKHPTSVAPLDLLLSVAESRICSGKTKPHSGPMNGIKIQLKEPVGEGIIKRAVIRDGFVYLCKGWKGGDESGKEVKLKHCARNVFDALFAGFSCKTSKLIFGNR